MEKSVLPTRSKAHIAGWVSAVVCCFTMGSVTDAEAAVDTCIEDGGTAFCIGPEVGPFRYQVSNGAFVAQGSDEASTIASFKQTAKTQMNACTLNLTDNLPPWPSVPLGVGAGNSSNGNYSNALYYGSGQYWSLNWYLSTETQAQRIPLVMTGTRYNVAGPSACQNNFGPFGAYVYRIRDVTCPGQNSTYGPNTSAPPNSYCYRAGTTPDPQKNLGSQCSLTRNPVNTATGNKFLPEADYIAPSPGTLQFIRYYNSKLWTGPYAPSGTQMYRSALGPMALT